MAVDVNVIESSVDVSTEYMVIDITTVGRAAVGGLDGGYYIPTVTRGIIHWTPSKSSMSDIPDSSLLCIAKTKEEWSKCADYIPEIGEFVVVTDYEVIDGVAFPGVKVGDGKAYAVDLPAIGAEVKSVITAHINNSDIHVTKEEKEYWNNKSDKSDEIDGVLYLK